jgi:hypothetical protein
MAWSRVFKTINGHRYVYEQRTWRDSGRVRTASHYVGREGRGEPILYHGSRGIIRGAPRPSQNATYGPGFYLASQDVAEQYAMFDPDNVSLCGSHPPQHCGRVYSFETAELAFLILKDSEKYHSLASLLSGNEGLLLPEEAKIEAQLRWAGQGYDGLKVLGTIKPATVVFPGSMHKLGAAYSCYQVAH